MGADFTIYADRADVEAIGQRSRGALKVWVERLDEPERAWVLAENGFAPASYLYVRTIADRYRGELRDFLEEVLDEALGDVVVLQDGDPVLRRRAGRMEYLLNADEWQRFLPPRSSGPIAAK